MITFEVSRTDFLGDPHSNDLLCYNATSTPRELTLGKDVVVHLNPFEASVIPSH